MSRGYAIVSARFGALGCQWHLGRGLTSRAVIAAGTAPSSTMTARPSGEAAATAAQISSALRTAAASAAAVAACAALGSAVAGGAAGRRMILLMPPCRSTCAQAERSVHRLLLLLASDRVKEAAS